jgi:glycosyltransferase involved in cell wall biosynthesis
MTDDQTMPPTVTVLLAVFNGQTYLSSAVDSVLSQTFRDFELLVIDDGSTDQTLPILREFEKADPRVRLITRPNKGLTNTLNEGLGLARGKYLARMDADDLCLPTRFEKQVAYLDAHPDCVLVGSRVLLIDPDGMPLKEMAAEATHEQIDAAHLNRGWPVVHPAVMMRLDAIQKAGNYRDEFNTLEDLDLFLRLGEIGKLANLPEVLLHYRQHFASVTHSKETQQMAIRQAIYDQTRGRRGLPRDVPPPPARTKPLEKFEQHRTWAWTALQNGHRKTARKHAMITLRLAPFAKESWRVMFCALRGH